LNYNYHGENELLRELPWKISRCNIRNGDVMVVGGVDGWGRKKWF